MTLRVAVRGDAAAVAEAVAAVDGVRLSADGDADAAVVLAVGEAALASFADDPPGTPVLPVDVDAGPYAVTHRGLPDALAALREGACHEAAHPVVAVSNDQGPLARAVFDACLLTSDPARISGYAVYDDRGRVDQFRADGVVVATPLGSGGYARAAGGPIVAPDAGLSVVPISPYATQSETWVLSPTIGLSVERDDSPVTLFVDGRDVRAVTPGTHVRVSPVESITVVTPTTA